MKYVLYIDYKADYTAQGNKSEEYITMEAKDLLEAIEEADKKFDKETMYLVRIMEKTGDVKKMDSGWKSQRYTAILCNRFNGWHRNTEEYSEGKHQVDRSYTKRRNGEEIDCYSIVFQTAF